MLELKNIVKHYPAGNGVVEALKGVSLQFRSSEFVSILGPSGCGKTTLLNIIGGLDRYTDGDLIINGRSTKDFRDRDWDTYRNHTIGFVFQSYNLIPHQTALRNVELALTLTGVSKSERRERAKAALEEVGLGDQLRKKPGEMSGGQMQRVAIARALVNNPDIILADEPTGALDTETSVSVMEILKKVAENRLVIMVTHNPDLAEQYSTRIIRVLDGLITDDSAPLTEQEQAAEHESDAAKIDAAGKGGKSAGGEKKPSMSLWTSFGLSFNNLVTKKGRTILTSFAGSIGIIGIALILALSTGIQNYIDRVQEDTLSSYPITLEAEQVDMSSLVSGLMGVNASDTEGEGGGGHELDAVYSNTIMYDLLDSLMQTEIQTNNLTDFKTYLESDGNGLEGHVSAVAYSYDIDMNIYARDVDGNIFLSDVTELLQSCMGSLYGGDYSSYFDTFGDAYSAMEVWQEMLPPQDGEDGLVNGLLGEQYDLIYGQWPQNYDEVVLIVNEDNEISDLVIYSMGLGSQDAVMDTLNRVMNGEELETFDRSWSYEELCSLTYKILLDSEYYQYDSATGSYSDITKTDAGIDFLYNDSSIGTTVKVVGILRPKEDAVSTMMSGAIGYTSALTEYLVEKTAGMEVLNAQKDDPDTDVISGLPFKTEDSEPGAEEISNAVHAYIETLTDSEKAAVYTALMSIPASDYLDMLVAAQSEGLTRETIEGAVVEQYAAEMGVDAETVASYIEQMDDETLMGYVTEALKSEISEQYAASVQEQLGSLTTEVLAGLLDAALTAEPAEESEAGTGDATANATEAGVATADSAAGYEAAVAAGAVPEGMTAEEYAAAAAMGGYNTATATGGSAVDYETALASGAIPEGMTAEEYAAATMGGYDVASATGGAAVQPAAPTALTEEQYTWLYENILPATYSDSTYEDNLKLLGEVDLASPKSISIYASTFEDKDAISDAIGEYNDSVDEEDRIEYTDYVALLMSGITKIINAISYVLIAFVAISLVVSSIMIGVITLISVQERTKEIGILRAIGASKRDVSGMFNMETVIIGFTSGVLGIAVTYLLCIPLNIIVHKLTGINILSAYLPPTAAIILILISIVLTLIAGIIPSRSAAKKDPVVALRTE